MNSFDQYYNYIKDMDLGGLRSEYHCLTPILLAKPVMTRLRHTMLDGTTDITCENPFDLLRLGIFSGKSEQRCDDTLLVIRITKESVLDYIKPVIESEHRSITVSELRNKERYMINISNSEKKTPLTLSNGKEIWLWEKPYQLTAMTAYDNNRINLQFQVETQDDGRRINFNSAFYIIGNIPETRDAVNWRKI